MDSRVKRVVLLAIAGLAWPGAAGASAAVKVTPVKAADAEAAKKLVFEVEAGFPDVSVQVTTADGTAKAGEDYTTVSRTLSFGPLDPPKQQVEVPVTDDTAVEVGETVKLVANSASPGTADVTAEATILNDDDPPLGLIVAPVGESATKQVVGVQLAVPTTKTATVKLATFDGTAKAGQDYTATSTTVTFAPGTTSQAVEVPLTGDDVFEGDEAFGIVLLEPSGAAPIANAASAGITEDDLPPVLTLEGPEPLAEGNRGETKTVPVKLRLSAAAAVPVGVGVATEPGTATQPVDYTGISEALAFAPGETEKTLTLTIKGDDQLEPDQRFRILAAPLANARTADGRPVAVTVVIRNDDRDTTPPKHTVGTPKLKGTLLSAVVSCPASEDRCDGRLTFFRDKQGRLAEKRLGARAFKLAGGQKQTVRVRLSRAAAAQARGKKVTAYALAADGSGNRATARRTARRLSG
jgi:hypothetical protein